MKKNLGSLIVCLLLSVIALAQKNIEGKISDAKSGLPVAAASVTVVGAKTGTGVSTDEKGNFTIKVNSAKAKLMISAVGYKAQIIELNGKTNLTIQLEVMAAVLDDIVVI